MMIVAPRHLERIDKVSILIASFDIPFVRRSSWTAAHPISGGIFLLDSVGELASVYALADVAFVGGSLVPLGGHNILEPAQHGVAVMTGPHTFNFREIIRIFAEGGALKITSAEDLPADLLTLLRNADDRKALGIRARELFLQNNGATEKTLRALQSLLAAGPRDAR